MLLPSSFFFRLACVAIGLYAILIGPWWLLLIAAFALSVCFAAYEVPLLGLLADIAWLPAYGTSIPYATLVALCMVWLLEPLRARFLTSVGV